MKKPYRIVGSIGFLQKFGSDKWTPVPLATLGRYQTLARAEQALPNFVHRGWDNATIVEPATKQVVR